MKAPSLSIAKQVIVVLAILITVACSWLTSIESAANVQVDAGLKRALTSFATARALNAVISVAEGTEVGIQPAGIGVKFALGQILRPLNDVVEQFAHLMLVASVAFGIERILITIGAHWLISATLTLISITWVLLYMFRHPIPLLLSRILVVMLMARFAMPIAIIGSNMLFDKFMANDYTTSQRIMEESTGKISALRSPSTVENQGWWDRLKALNPEALRTELSSRLSSFKFAVEQTTERVIKLMVVFVLQTLILPILILWILWGITRDTLGFSSTAMPFLTPRKQVA